MNMIMGLKQYEFEYLSYISDKLKKRNHWAKDILNRSSRRLWMQYLPRDMLV
jgi:hypothetical protein